MRRSESKWKEDSCGLYLRCTAEVPVEARFRFILVNHDDEKQNITKGLCSVVYWAQRRNCVLRVDLQVLGEDPELGIARVYQDTNVARSNVRIRQGWMD